MIYNTEYSQKISFPALSKQNGETSNVNQVVYFNVGPNYKILEAIGTGAYGVVCSAIDKNTEKHVAIKKIMNAFDILTTAKRTLRELKLLLHFKHDNIVGIRNIIQNDKDKESGKDIYFVMDLLRTDLHHVIRSDQEITIEHIRYFSYQLLRGLKYIHSAGVIHRDLKPSNLLINENCDLRIGDFGMARGISMQSEQYKHFMTEYVTTRWYRAPELMLSIGQYNQAIDIWSVGCIFAEMIGRKQIFPGKDYVQQLQLIISVLGSPKKQLVNSIRSERVRSYVVGLPDKSPTSLRMLYPKASEEMLIFLQSLLQFDPQERPSADSALNNSFFATYHNINDEPICHQHFDFCFEAKITCEEVQEQVNDVIRKYHQRKNRFLKQLVLVKKPTSLKTNDEDTQRLLSSAGNKDPNETQISSAIEVANEITALKKGFSVKPFKSESEVAAKKLIKFSDYTSIKTSDCSEVPCDSTSEASSQPMITVQVDFSPSAISEAQVIENKSSWNKSGKNRNNEKSFSSVIKGKVANPKITISEETKMKVRDVIFASMLAKQKGLGKPLDKVRKPITAADRQKEREEKRKKRHEKSLEKERRRKKQENSNETITKPELSEEDKDLVQRWTKMQQSKTSISENTISSKAVHQQIKRIDLTKSNQNAISKTPINQSVVLVLNKTSIPRDKNKLSSLPHMNISKDEISSKSTSKLQFSQDALSESSKSRDVTSENLSLMRNDEKISESSSVCLPTASTAPCRPESLFTLPLQTSSKPASSVQLTPGTLLEISGGNTNKKLTTLSPDTIESVFASEALITNSNLKLDPSTMPYDLSNSAEGPKLPSKSTTDHFHQSSSTIGSFENNSTTNCDKFSPSDFLRSPHFSTTKIPETNFVQTENITSMTSVENKASGYGVGTSTYLQNQFNSNDKKNQLGSDDLLAGWLDINTYMQPLEMEALQRELEMGSPMSVDDVL